MATDEKESGRYKRFFWYTRQLGITKFTNVVNKNCATYEN